MPTFGDLPEGTLFKSGKGTYLKLQYNPLRTGDRGPAPGCHRCRTSPDYTWNAALVGPDTGYFVHFCPDDSVAPVELG